jgi:hypothetical protein
MIMLVGVSVEVHQGYSLTNFHADGNPLLSKIHAHDF